MSSDPESAKVRVTPKKSPRKTSVRPRARAADAPASSTRTLSAAQSAHIRRRLQEILDDPALDLSQSGLARELGVSQQVINRIMLGDPTGLYVALRLAEYDRVPVWAILESGPARLESTVLHHRQWSRATVAAVRDYARIYPEKYADYTEGDWIELLDLIEESLIPLLVAGVKKTTDR